MKLTKLGQIVCFSAIAIVSIELVIGLFWLIDHINWVGDHYCFHSSIQCYFGDNR